MLTMYIDTEQDNLTSFAGSLLRNSLVDSI